MSKRRNRYRPSSSSQSTTTQTLTRKALYCLAPYANVTALAHASRVWSCTITFRWSTSSILLTMHWVAKSWNLSGAVGDVRSRLSWPRVICHEVPRCLRYRPAAPQETRAFCRAEFDGHARSPDGPADSPARCWYGYILRCQ